MPHFLHTNVSTAVKISLLIRASGNKNLLARKPFFRNSLAGASGLVLMSDPAVYQYFQTLTSGCYSGFGNRGSKLMIFEI